MEAAIALLETWLLQAGDTEAQLATAATAQLVTLGSARFDPAKVDSLLQGTLAADVPASALPWLDALLERPQWRELIYALHGKHPSSAFLELALLRLLQSEHAVEARSRAMSLGSAVVGGGSAVTQLIESLPERLAARLAGVPGASSDLVSLCTADGASAACAAVLLGDLAEAATVSDHRFELTFPRPIVRRASMGMAG